jgi:hypothetical protein
LALLLALALIGAYRLVGRRVQPDASEVVFQPQLHILEGAPLCPWRNPEADRLLFFPGSTRSEAATLILSGHRLELEQRLGRQPGPDENSLALQRILTGDQTVGSVLTRRVKGEHGAIEIVVAVDSQQRVQGVKLQRLREPDAVAAALTNAAWLSSFVGKGAETKWRVGEDVAALPTEALPSGQAICDGVRSLLVLLAVAPIQPQPTRASHH